MRTRQFAGGIAWSILLGVLGGIALHFGLPAWIWSSAEHQRRAESALERSRTLRQCYGVRLLELANAVDKFRKEGEFDSPQSLIDVTMPVASSVWNKGRTYAELTKRRTEVWVDLLASSSIATAVAEGEACLMMEAEANQRSSRNTINNLIATLAQGWQVSGKVVASWNPQQREDAEARFTSLIDEITNDRQAPWGKVSDAARRDARLFFAGDHEACARIKIPRWESAQRFQCPLGQ